MKILLNDSHEAKKILKVDSYVMSKTLTATFIDKCVGVSVWGVKLKLIYAQGKYKCSIGDEYQMEWSDFEDSITFYFISNEDVFLEIL